MALLRRGPFYGCSGLARLCLRGVQCMCKAVPSNSHTRFALHSSLLVLISEFTPVIYTAATCSRRVDGCGEVLCQTNLNALGELEMCYDVYISRQSPFFSVTQSYSSQNSGRCTPALRSKLLEF